MPLTYFSFMMPATRDCVTTLPLRREGVFSVSKTEKTPFCGTLLSFIGRRMDFLHFRLRRIRFCFLLCLVKKARLGKSICVLFAGCAKLFPLRKGQTVREHRVHEYQVLCFFLRGPGALLPVSDTAPAWFSLG